MSSPVLPPTDRIVYALWADGKVRAAMELASHALARGDRARALLHEQLDLLGRGEVIEPGPTPIPALDLALVMAMVDRYRYYEALCVLQAVAMPEGEAAERLATLLEDALAPFPPEADSSFEAALHLVRAGQAPSALRAIEEVVRQSPDPALWLTAKQRALAALVQGQWKAEATEVEAVTRDTVLERIRKRDLPGALDAARRAGARELSAVLTRLVMETERIFTDHVPEADDPMTVPMEGHGLAEFHIRMGILKEADRVYRRILSKEPADERARALLTDVIALRRALGEDAEPLPRREIPSVDWLSKKKRPQGKAEWSTGERWQRIDDDAYEESTEHLDASQEAELLVKLGKAEQALDVYRILAIRHPKQRTYQRRINEIEALIAQRMAPMESEATLRHDMRELSAQAVRTNPRVVLTDISAVYPRIGEDDDPTTTVDDLPKRNED